MTVSIYEKTTKELFKEFVEYFVSLSVKGFGLIKGGALDEGGHFKRHKKSWRGFNSITSSSEVEMPTHTLS